jgi:hypothetical protein
VLVFYGEGLLKLAQPTVSRTTACQMSAAAYSLYSLLLCMSGDSLLREDDSKCDVKEIGFDDVY